MQHGLTYESPKSIIKLGVNGSYNRFIKLDIKFINDNIQVQEPTHNFDTIMNCRKARFDSAISSDGGEIRVCRQ